MSLRNYKITIPGSKIELFDNWLNNVFEMQKYTRAVNDTYALLRSVVYHHARLIILAAALAKTSPGASH
jgi:hypothetical protein